MPITGTPNSLSLADTTLLLKSLSVPTEGDLVAALLEQLSRTLSRTSAGVDYLNAPFAGYSSARTQDFTLTKQAARRPVTLTASTFTHSHSKSTSIPRTRLARPQALPISRSSPIPGLRTSAYHSLGSGISLSSSTASKGNVDLSASGKMLSELTVIVAGRSFGVGSTAPSINSLTTPVLTGEYGVVGSRADVARYHMEGTDKLPQRKFLGDSPSDLLEIERVIFERRLAALTEFYAKS